MIIIGVDTGGTFTDFVYKDKDRCGTYKILSTPWNPAEAGKLGKLGTGSYFASPV